MTMKLNREHFKKFMEQTMAGEEDLGKQYEAWGIDPNDLDQFVTELTMMSLLRLYFDRDPKLTLYTAITIGIELGYRMALELEQERIAHGPESR